MPRTLYHTPAAAAADANAGMVVGAGEEGEEDADAHETWVSLERLSQVGASLGAAGTGTCCCNVWPGRPALR